jgi:endonuclease-3 related protein
MRIMFFPALATYRRLLESLGPQKWWPGQSPFEVMVGAVLVQNTAWKNVERAIENLRDAGALTPGAIAKAGPEELEQLVRPAGYFRVKARRLRNLANFIVERYAGSLEAMRAADVATLRGELLEVHGIGPETADSILLYALDKPVLVVDAYTMRVWARHGWIEPDAGYYRLQEEASRGLPEEAAVFNELHALVVEVGKRWCRRTAQCASCPLAELLPPCGVVELM